MREPRAGIANSRPVPTVHGIRCDPSRALQGRQLAVVSLECARAKRRMVGFQKGGPPGTGRFRPSSTMRRCRPMCILRPSINMHRRKPSRGTGYRALELVLSRQIWFYTENNLWLFRPILRRCREVRLPATNHRCAAAPYAARQRCPTFSLYAWPTTADVRIPAGKERHSPSPHVRVGNPCFSLALSNLTHRSVTWPISKTTKLQSTLLCLMD